MGQESLAQSVEGRLMQGFENAGNISILELETFFTQNSPTCVVPESYSKLKAAEVQLKEVVLAESGPLFPEQRFKRLLGPHEISYGLNDESLLAMKTTETSYGLETYVSQNQTKTTYRSEGASIFFKTDRIITTDYCISLDYEGVCDDWEDLETPEVLVGYCYL